MNLTIPYLKNLQSPDAENWGYKINRDILTFDWGSRLDLVAAKKWDTFRKCGCKKPCKKPCSTNNRCGCPRPLPPQLKQMFSGAQHSAAAFAMCPIIISF